MRWLTALTLLLLVSACDDETTNPPAGATPSAAPGASAQASAPGATDPAAPAAAGPVCTSIERRVVAQGANPRTGLTPQRLGERGVAIGVAIGDRPHRLEIDAEGKATLSRPTIAEGHALVTAIAPKEGVRHLQRVTVTGGNAAFADYRDKYESGRRRVACGPLHEKEPFLYYDGLPILDADDSGRGREETPPATPDVAAGGGSPGGGGAGPDAKARDVVLPPKKPGGADVELRDCRTFADATGKDVWAVGSELARETEDGETSWKMRFFVAPNAARDPRVVLHTIDLGESPKKLHTLEAPIAHRLADGSYVLAGRYQGKMLAWLLGADKHKKSDLRQYAGGYPGLPRVVSDGGEHLLLTSQKVDLAHWKLRALRLPNPAKLEPSFSAVAVEGDSAAEPTVAHVGAQRWLAFHAGERRDGQIFVVPVDAELKPVGKPHPATHASTAAYESHVFSFGDELLLTYIALPGPKKPTELVVDRLKCSVQN